MNNQQQEQVTLDSMSLEQMQALSDTFAKKCDLFRTATTLVSDLITPFLPSGVLKQENFEDLVRRFHSNELEQHELKWFSSVPGFDGVTFSLEHMLLSPEMVEHINNNITNASNAIAQAVDTIADAKARLSVYDTVVSFVHLERALSERYRQAAENLTGPVEETEVQEG